MAERTDLRDRPLDLKKTLECGQTFLWNRESGEEGTYYTVRNGGVLKVWQDGDVLYYENLGEEIDPVEVLRLDDPLQKIYETIKRDNLMERSMTANRGLRVVNDEFFPCLISYITSSQMRIQRIKQFQEDIRKRFGENLRFDGDYYEFPSAERLASVSEDELRNLNLGYRAAYIKRTSEMVADGAVKEEQIREMDYPEAKEELKKLPGVGDKVADCVLLFSLGFLKAFPIDTWIKKAVKENYPELYSKNYGELSKNMRDYFGNYAGYAQQYLFHYSRTCMDL